MVNGILWLKRTGAPWRDIPAGYGKWFTIASRFYRWCKQGIRQRLWATLQQQADALERSDWEPHYVDGTVIRAHQHAAGAHETTPDAQALGRSQGGFRTKSHVRAEGGGKPLPFVLTAGQRHEAVVFEHLMEQGAVKRGGRGRPRQRPRRVVGDKGYSSRTIRTYVRRRHIRYTIPRTQNERRTGPLDRAIYRTRNRVERLIHRLKQSRRIATRDENYAVDYRALLTIAAIQLWLCVCKHALVLNFCRFWWITL
jgi:transposase